jgi:hypothetical protein
VPGRKDKPTIDFYFSSLSFPITVLPKSRELTVSQDFSGFFFSPWLESKAGCVCASAASFDSLCQLESAAPAAVKDFLQFLWPFVAKKTFEKLANGTNRTHFF